MIARSAPGDGVVAALACDPAEAEIGQPVQWTLTVEHPAGAKVRVATADPFAAKGWVVLGEPRSSVTAAPDPARAVTAMRWSAFALEPGERAPESVRVEVELADKVLSAPVDVAKLVVRPALLEGEDAPRPLAGFHPAPAATGSALPLAIGGALLLVLLVALALVVRARRRARAAAPRPAGPLEELARIERELAGQPDDVRGPVYALSALVRRSVDAAVGDGSAERSGLTDEEWTARLARDARMPESRRGELARLLAALEPVKYGHSAPTRFFLEDLLARARVLLSEIERERALETERAKRGVA